MAGYKFKDVSISICKVQPTIEPHCIAASNYYKENFKFLGDFQSYNKITNRITTQNFIFDPLPRRYREKNKFWYHFIDDSKDRKCDSINLLLPLVGTLKKDDNLHIKYCDDFEIKPKIQIYLSPLGWATIMSFRLQEKDYIRSKHLIKIMEILTGKKSQPSFIKSMIKSLDARKVEVLDIEDVFNDYQKLLLKDLYVDKIYAPCLIGENKFRKYFLVSVNHFEGDIVDYNKMVPADEALMNGILFGEKYDVIRVVQGRYPNILRTYLNGPGFSFIGFALTRFDHGTVLFPQREANKSNNVIETIAFYNNIREFLIMTLTFLNFYNRSDDYIGKGKDMKKINELRSLVRVNLCRIKNSYNNQFCQNFFSKHKTLKKLIDKRKGCNLSSSCEFKPDR